MTGIFSMSEICTSPLIPWEKSDLSAIYLIDKKLFPAYIQCIIAEPDFFIPEYFSLPDARSVI